MPGLIHSLAIVTPTEDVSGDVDEYGQPIAGEPTVAYVQGLVQPIGAREAAQVNQAGAAVHDHRIFLALQADPANGAHIRFEPDNGDRYEVQGTDRFEYGGLAHLEVRCKRVVSPALVTS